MIHNAPLGDVARCFGHRGEFLGFATFFQITERELASKARQILNLLAGHPQLGPQYIPPKSQLDAIRYDAEKRWEYRKEHRNIPSDQLEQALVDAEILPPPQDKPPHRPKMAPIVRKSDQSSAKKQAGRAKKRNKKPAAAKPPTQASIRPMGYPSIKATETSDSLSVAAPTSQTILKRSGKPMFQYLPNGACIITHRELVADVAGQSAFNLAQYSLNAGLVGTFPWLSKIAGNYESYTFLSLVCSYETTSSTAGTGVVQYTIDYDAADAAPTDKFTAANYEGTVRASPWCPMHHVSTTRNLKKRAPYFVRAGGLAPGLDLQQYDSGNLYVITQGMGSPSNIGELWIQYTCKLETPRSLSSGGGSAVWGQYQVVDNATAPTYVSGNLPVTVSLTVSGAGYQVTFTFTSPWQGECLISHTGTGLGAGAWTGTALVANSTSGNGNTTGITQFAKAKATPTQTMIYTCPNTTVTPATPAGGFFFTQGFGNYQ